MATNIQIISARDFVKATPEGKFDFEKSMDFLISIASASAALSDHETLIDTRKTDCELSASELWHLAAELDSRRRAFSGRTAVLCPVERFDQAGFFALCAHNRGFRVKAFAAFEDAIEWLMTSPE
jgi:hypothetical protein